MRQDKSYERYRQYRENQYRYKVDQIVFPVGVIIILALLIQYWKLIVGVIAIILFLIVFFAVRRKRIMKSTDLGFINKNNQKFYAMECLNCGHTYKANGTDIWQRKCPKCQGGRP